MDSLDIKIAKRKARPDILPKERIGPIQTSSIHYVLLSLISPQRAREEQNAVMTYLQNRLDNLSEHNPQNVYAWTRERAYRQALRLIYKGANPRKILKKISDFSFEIRVCEQISKKKYPKNPFE